MIGRITYEYGRVYVCDDCKKNFGRFKSYDEAKNAGWAIGRGRRNCYCPKCAPRHRHVGRGAAAKECKA